MRPDFKNLFVQPLMVATFSLLIAVQSTAQTFKTLHSFSTFSGNPLRLATNGDGAGPGGLILSGNKLYGTTYEGGSADCGTVFSLNTDGSTFTNMHVFISDNSYWPILGAGEGDEPASVTAINNKIYGVSTGGGSPTVGTVFSVNEDGTEFTNLFSFTGGSNGKFPDGVLILAGDTLFGTASAGASNAAGLVFAINTDGSGFTNLYSFTDQGQPYAGLILTNSTLYGTTLYGGSSGDGTVFTLSTNGTSFTNLHSFSGGDGNSPYAGLIFVGNVLYGATAYGGNSGNGTVFALNADGTGFTNLHYFSGTDGSECVDLILSGNTLYGTTVGGGISGSGTVFAIKTDGTGFTNLYNFAPTASGAYYPTNSDGIGPNVLALSGDTLYGTTKRGGIWGSGTVFSLTLPPRLTIACSGPNVILTWPTNVAGFDYTGYALQSTASLGSPVWSAVSPPPVIVNGLNTVTNAISGTQMFYRLVQ